MARKLSLQNLRRNVTQLLTHEGAAAYDYRDNQPLIHLTFTMGSALFTDGFYTREEQQVCDFAEALIAAGGVDPRFPWQYAAWMRDPREGKGNRIQGSLAPALLDALLGETEYTRDYVARCLSHRPDDVTTFMTHFRQLHLGAPSAVARAGMAAALASFDEYQLMKYAGQKSDVRLCDAIGFVRAELEALGESGQLALAAGRYLHAPTRRRVEHLEGLPLTAARRGLFTRDKAFAGDPAFEARVRDARVTWEQVVGHFGESRTRVEGLQGAVKNLAVEHNHAIWRALLRTPGLLPDMAFLRNLRNLRAAGFSNGELVEMAETRGFKGVWPHQVYAGWRAADEARPAFEAIFRRLVPCLPEGRHLGIADASGSMTWVKVGGVKGSTRPLDAALCLTGLMSETSRLGASFSGSTIHVAERGKRQGPLAFSQNRLLNQGGGGTQVFGAILNLIEWLRKNDHIAPPECLWFFSDMQFHPARSTASSAIPTKLRPHAQAAGYGKGRPPLEMALEIYRELLGPVDVVLWNLAAYAPVPVPSDMKGVLLVSGFDANTLRFVDTWRKTGAVPGGETRGGGTLESNHEVILEKIRSY